MARPIEDKPWHADALRMKKEGASFSQIAEALGVNISTLKAFVIRSSKNPERQLEAVLKDKKPKVAPVDLPKAEQRTLIEIVMLVERRRAKTMMNAMVDIEAFHRLTVADMDSAKFKLATMKMQAGIETMKALKGGAGTIDVDLASKPPKTPGGGGGSNDSETEKLIFEIVDPEELGPGVPEAEPVATS